MTDLSEDPSRMTLRLLATTDIHANLLGFDYRTDRPRPGIGLARLEPCIAALRDEVGGNVLLLDNGDTQQGNALADLAASSEAQGPHPIIAAMNRLGYDAAGLGNHDFDYGVGQLRRAIGEARFPFVLSNLRVEDGPALAPPVLLLERAFTDDDGTSHVLRIGVLSVVPCQTLTWVGEGLGARMSAEPMLDAVRTRLHELRSDHRADCAVVLAHTGLAKDGAGDDGENMLAEIVGSGLADAVIGGHTHKVLTRVEPNGTAQASPMVQPGAFGSHVGVIDLRLERGDDDRWTVTDAQTRVEPASSADTVAGDVEAAAKAAHEFTRKVMNTALGQATAPIESYGARIGGCSANDLIAQAKRDAAERLLKDAGQTDRPLLVAVSATRNGDNGNWSDYHDIPAGRFLRRHLFDLYPFTNRLMVLALSGAEIFAWLERAAAQFRSITPGAGAAPQPLIASGFAGYNFDAIDGAYAEYDLARPAWVAGSPMPAPGQGRVAQISIDGVPIRPNDRFALAATSYRVGGGGDFMVPGRADVLASSEATVRDLIADHVTRHPTVGAPARRNWNFAPLGGAVAEIRLGTGALDHAESLRSLGWTLADAEPIDGDASLAAGSGYLTFTATL